MADLIRIKSGAVSEKRPEMPKLSESELGYRTDTKELYIGTDSENVRLCGENDVAMVRELQSTINSLSEIIEGIITRLEALEKPSE